MKLIKKISAITLGVAMAAGVGVSLGKSAREVKAEEKAPIVIDPVYLGISGDVTTQTTFTATDKLTYVGAPSSGQKINSQSIGKAAENRLSSNSGLMIGKSGAYLYNTSEMPYDIVSVDIYATTACSTSVKISLDFDDEIISSKGSGSDVSLNTKDKIYNFEAPESCKYFRLNVTNANNAQIQMKVNFEKKADVAVTGVELNKESTTLLVGHTEQLVATVSPNDATDPSVSWESSDETVATVNDEGVIDALKVGSTTITVKTTDGEYIDSCAVTVSENNCLKDTLDITSLKIPSNYGGAESDEFATGSKYLSNGTINNKANIQLRSTDSSGIVSSQTVGFVKAVRVDVASGEKVFDVYGSNTAYTSTADLYDNSKKGTKIGSGKGTTTIIFEDNYQYIGIRSNSGAIYLADIIVEWEPVKPTSISLTADSSSITLGNTKTIVPTFINGDFIVTDKGLSWSSDNTDVATVSNGVVTAVGEGKATITATSTADTNVKGTIEITVSSEIVNVESVTLSPKSLEMVDGQEVELIYTVLPVDASNKSVSWSSDNTDVATVSDKGVVKAISAGSATITVTTEDGEKTATCEVTVTMRPRVSYELVTDASKLVVGAKYIIIGCKSETYYVMNHFKTGDSNVKASEITAPVKNIITGLEADVDSNTYILGGEDGLYTFFDGEKYLYAAGGSDNNHLKASATLSEKSKFNISFNESNVLVVCADETTTHNTLRFNSTLFSCYLSDSTTGTLPYLYRIVPQAETADSFALNFLKETESICSASGDHGIALKSIWDNLSATYGNLSLGEKDKILADNPTGMVKSMLERYDYIVNKYSLENFITGHVVSSVNGLVRPAFEDNNNAVTIIVIVSVVSISCLGALIVIKRRKAINK